MLNFLPAPVIGGLTSVLLAFNTLFWCLPLYGVVLAKLVIPHKGWRRGCTRVAIWLAEAWIRMNSGWMWLTQKTDWQVTLPDDLSPQNWYLVISNHLSWADIFVLQHLFNKRIPFLKFFIKQELIWVPVIGLAWWGLDFPFMKRYSKKVLEKRPHLRGKDLETTRKACEKFKLTPVSVMNFLEGTRITPEKHARQDAPYDNLLKPKAGGIAFVLAAMDGRIDTMLDVTIAYPDGIPSAWDFLCGRVHHIIVHVQERTIPQSFLHGDYRNDSDYRETFQAWVRELWQEKDERMAAWLEEPLSQRAPVG